MAAIEIYHVFANVTLRNSAKKVGLNEAYTPKLNSNFWRLWPCMAKSSLILLQDNYEYYKHALFYYAPAPQSISSLQALVISLVFYAWAVALIYFLHNVSACSNVEATLRIFMAISIGVQAIKHTSPSCFENKLRMSIIEVLGVGWRGIRGISTPRAILTSGGGMKKRMHKLPCSSCTN